MADFAKDSYFSNPVRRIFRVIRLEKNEISSIYFYAILSGLIQLSMPLGIQSIISFVLGGAISTSLVVLIILVVLGVLLTGLLRVNQMKLIEKVQQKLFVRYSFAFADRIPRLDLQAVDSYYLPELVNRFFDTISLQKGISKLLLEIPIATIQILFGLILLSFYHPVFIFFGLILILIVYLILRLSGPRGMETSLRESDYKYAVAGWLEEMARVVKSFKFSRHTSLNIDKTDKLVSGYLESRSGHFKILLLQYWSLIGFKVLITAAMLIVGTFLLVNNQLNIGQFIAAEIVILMVIGSVEKIIVNIDKVYDVLTSVEKLSKVTDKPIEIDGETQLVPTGEGLAIEMHLEAFRYAQYQTDPVLKNIHLSIAPNEKIGIIGAAGSGKSSLLRLLSGAYPEFEGAILINQLPIGSYDLASLRAQTGILLSQQDIFQGTLLDNITLGNTSIAMPEIQRLAAQVGLLPYLIHWKDGFNTALDPTGRKLSQKLVQKILLMRALLHQPAMLLLEDPFEGLEKSQKDNMINLLFAEAPHQTILLTTNDPAVAALCNRIIYMQEGKIVAIGKWSDIQQLIQP
jgi:ATP-binding cassette, subfamily B, bacterial